MILRRGSCYKEGLFYTQINFFTSDKNTPLWCGGKNNFINKVLIHIYAQRFLLSLRRNQTVAEQNYFHFLTFIFHTLLLNDLLDLRSGYISQLIIGKWCD